jgi:hypothetical protein
MAAVVCLRAINSNPVLSKFKKRDFTHFNYSQRFSVRFSFL